MQPIVFYDIPGNATKDKAWSPNTWKTRYSLNYKGVPYTTVWVEYPDIAALCEKISAPPTEYGPDGSPKYTLPAIYDPNTGAAVSESAVIARYLDKTYPDTPVLIPPETDAFHMAFSKAFSDSLLADGLMIALPATNAQLNPRSEAYFRATRQAKFNAKMEEFAPPGSEKRARHWARVEKALHMFSEWLGADGRDKLFFMGDKISYADITIASFLLWICRVSGDESKEEKDIRTWDGGRWGKLLDTLRKYENVEL